MQTKHKKSLIHSLFVAVLLLYPTAFAAPITDPADPRNWQGASLETFRSLLGLATLMRQGVTNFGAINRTVWPYCINKRAQ